MGSAWTTLVAVVVGGLISLFGTFLVARYQAQREEARLSSQIRREDERLARNWQREDERLDREDKRLDRDRLRMDLYQLQDALEEVFRRYAVELEPPVPLFLCPDLRSAIIRLNMQAIRVGDQPIANSVATILERLAEARNAGQLDARWGKYNAALDLLSPVHHRVGELLHTDTKVDLGA